MVSRKASTVSQHERLRRTKTIGDVPSSCQDSIFFSKHSFETIDSTIDVVSKSEILSKTSEMIKPLKRVDRLVFHNSSSQSSIQEADFTASVSRVAKKDYENSKSSLFVTPESSQIITE